MLYLIKQRGIPSIRVPYPANEEEAKVMLAKIRKFLRSLSGKNGKHSDT
jgi:hypothetical protein